MLGPDGVPDTGVATITVAATAKTFTRSAGSYITDGFTVGQTVQTTGYANAGNNATKIISVLTATVLTVSDGTGLVNEAGTGDERVKGYLAVPLAITLAAFPGKDYRRLFQVFKERMFLELSQDSFTTPFLMNRMEIYTKPLGMRPY